MKPLQLFLILFLFPFINQKLAAQHLYWENIGDYNYVLDIKENSNGHLFICQQDNGIIRSADDGETWEYLSIPSSDIGKLAINGNDWIFAADRNRINNSIFRSEDSGNTWTECNLSGGKIRCLYISREGYIYAGNESGRFFKSTDDGTTWASDSITDKRINCIGACSNGQIFVGTDGAGIFSSNDYGETWFQLYNSNDYFYSMVINPEDNIFVTTFEDVLISEDYGISWSSTNISLYQQSVLGIDSSGTVYVSRSGIRKTTNNGQTWTELGGPYYINAIEPYGDKIYLATSSGVFRYDPDVIPPNLLGSNFLPLYTNNEWQYLETTSTSNGNSYGLVGTTVQFDTLISNKTYYKLSSYPDLIRYSQDERKLYLRWNDSDYIWVDFNVPLDNEYQTWGPLHSYHTVLALGGEHHIFGRDLVYGGYESDMGSSITDIIFTDSIGITEDYTGLSWGPVWSYDDDLIEAILYDSTGNAIFITNHFKPEFEMTPITTIDTVLFHLNFMIFHNYTHLGSMWNSGLDFIDSVKMFSYYSKDDSIVSVPIIIPSHVPNPVNRNYSVSKQMDTTLLKNGFTFNYRFTAKDKGIIPEYTNSPDSGYYQCVWQDPVNVTSVSKKPVIFSLSQNYPNPFNPTTKIKFQLPQMSKVKLTVYDVLGRELKTLVSEEKPAGTYEVEFDGTNLPSGVYFYRIEAGQYTATKKLILLK